LLSNITIRRLLPVICCLPPAAAAVPSNRHSPGTHIVHLHLKLNTLTHFSAQKSRIIVPQIAETLQQISNT